MLVEKIKPIPKYIEKKIVKLDNKIKDQQHNYVRFYAYLTTNNKELVKVTVAVKNKNNKTYCKQVAVHGIHSDYCFYKDIELNYVGGYMIDWYEEGLQKEPRYYYSNGWYEADDKYFNPFAIVINKEYPLKYEQYKYSYVDHYKFQNIIKYLRYYEQYPETEYFVKAGLDSYATSKTLLKTAHNDKTFRKWLFRQKEILKSRDYYVSVIIKSYKTGKDLDDLQKIERYKKSIIHDCTYSRLIKDLKCGDKLTQYLMKKDISLYSYSDYIHACKGLEIDLTKDRNIFPHDFQRWHDIRINEYHTKQAKLNAKKEKEYKEAFIKVAQKYISLEEKDTDKYVVIIAKMPADLVKEGKELNHCVGTYGYDQKFIKEESLIFFVRDKSNIKKPYVTLEYSLSARKILQCYGNHDSKPIEEVLEFVNKKWLPYANKQMKKLAA